MSLKIILTEEQVNNLILTECINETCTYILNETMDFNSIKKTIKKLILSGIATAVIFNIISNLQISNEKKMELENMLKTERELVIQKEKEDSIRGIKVKACSDYMKKALHNQGFNDKSTKLTAEALVKASEEHNFDLPLLMAAAHLESCFGATKRAKRTNSVFSVGSYDNGKDMVSYSHPNESIYGYIDLLNNNYLVNGKTIHDLLKPGCFINKNGHRYASKKNYEKMLAKVRNRIIQNYPELV